MMVRFSVFFRLIYQSRGLAFNWGVWPGSVAFLRENRGSHCPCQAIAQLEFIGELPEDAPATPSVQQAKRRSHTPSWPDGEIWE